MTIAVVDANVLVRGALSENPKSASRGVVDALLSGQFVLELSRDAMDELLQVLAQDDVRARHGEQSDEQILDFCRAVDLHSQFVEPTSIVPATVTRDPTDVKWLALAADGEADYLVTLDNRHLLRLKHFGRTKIVRPRAFLRALEQATS